jgi:hypothetical protein
VHEILMFVHYLSGRAALRRYLLRGPTFLRRHVRGVLTCLLMLGMLLLVNLRFLPEIAMLRDFTDIPINEERVNIAIAIDQLTTPDATVGVFDAGAIPYYTGRPAIDYLGKADSRIARMAPDPSGFPRMKYFEGKIYNPGHNKYDLGYSIKELRPTYSRGFIWGGQNVLDWGRSEYVTVVYRDTRVNFLKGSEDVRWDDIEAAREAGEAPLGAPTQ